MSEKVWFTHRKGAILAITLSILGQLIYERYNKEKVSSQIECVKGYIARTYHEDSSLIFKPSLLEETLRRNAKNYQECSINLKELDREIDRIMGRNYVYSQK